MIACFCMSRTPFKDSRVSTLATDLREGCEAGVNVNQRGKAWALYYRIGPVSMGRIASLKIFSNAFVASTENLLEISFTLNSFSSEGGE